MKITRHEVLIKQGDAFDSSEFQQMLQEIEMAISKVVWPPKAEGFFINPKAKGNGVKPIKNNCMKHLESVGWKLEDRLSVTSSMRPGPLDATKTLNNKSESIVALEWETGNISSSHRAINKMALGIVNQTLVGGILILPSRAMYKYLTDRVGNFQEIEPYFPVWKNLKIEDGYLSVIEIEHDCENEESPLIPKGTDGWAEYQRLDR